MYTKETFASTKRAALEKLAEQINEANGLFALLQKVTHLSPGPAGGQPGHTTDDHLLKLVYRRDYNAATAFLYTRGRSDG